jgi:4-amino-4-deoxy-L-arabinose transferase-like glycosyltransferase
MGQKRLGSFMNNFFKKNIYLLIFALILVLSVFLRFNKIDVNPPSLDWDEASMGYNAYSLLTTGADEYGNKLPLSIRSFGDYKPPVYTYLAVPSVLFFGLNETGVRFPAALFGSLSVIVIYFLTKELFNNFEKDKKEKLALLSMIFLGVSPWHLQFSRAAFEGNIGLFFFMLGLLLFLKSLKNTKLAIVAIISFCLSIYSYHSFLLIAPIFMFILILLFWQEIVKNKKYYIVSLILGLIFAVPVFLNFTSSNGSSSRFSMVSLFASPDILNTSIKELEYDKTRGDVIGEVFHNRRVVYFLETAKAYFDHWNPDFLFFHGDGGRQHHAVGMGMLYLFDLPFILIGIYFLFKNRTKRNMLLATIFLLAPLPSAISTGTPHPVRAIAMIPGFTIFTALGVYALFLNSKTLRNKLLLFAVVVLFIINFSYYIHRYYVDTPIAYGDFWQYGNKEALLTAKSLENKYDKIIYTYIYDQPYVYYLFYNKVDPSWYQKNWDYQKTDQVERMRRVIGEYEFRNIDWGKDSQLKNTLLIGSPQEIPANANGLIKTIYFLDGSVAFRIVGT